MPVGERPLVDRAQLVLADRLARVVLGRDRRCLARIVPGLRARQAQRILRIGGIEMVEQQVQRAGTRAEPQLGVQRFPPRRAVVAVALRIQHGRRHAVAHHITGTTQARADHAAVVAGHAGLHARFVSLVGDVAPHLDHAAGGVAMQRRERTAQHFDPVRREHGDVRDLALPVRHRRRHAIGVQPQPAHTEGGTRAEAADRQLRVLREVLPFARQHAGNSVQHFRQGRLRTRAALAECDHAGRCRRIEAVHRLQSRRGDDHAIQRFHRRRRFARGRGQRGRRQQRRAQQRRDPRPHAHAWIIRTPACLSSSSSGPAPSRRTCSRRPCAAATWRR